MTKCEMCLSENFELLNTSYKELEDGFYKEIALVRCIDCEHEYELETNNELYGSVRLQGE